jgi:hypothetical protein
VYFAESAQGRQPNVRLGYGGVTPYLELPGGVTGLLVTGGGDTSNVIMRINQSFGLTGLFGTVVIRGSTDPQGTEPLPSPVVLSDRELGTAVFSITSIFVRFVNGSRDSKLSLYTKGPLDALVRINAPGQEEVLCIPPDSASAYWSITKLFHGEANWYFGSSQACDRSDTSYFHTYRESLRDLTRYTMAAMQTSKLGVSPATWDHLTILDTMGSPRGSTHGRVRFVNLSPDATVTIETPSGTRTLTQGQIEYVDYPVGARSFVSNGKTVTFTVGADDPKTVWFGAASASDPLPYHVSED